MMRFLLVFLLSLSAGLAARGQNVAFSTAVAPRAGVPINATFNAGDFVFDREGAIYFTVPGEHTIRKLTADGTNTVIAGKAGEWGLKDGPGATARFYSPSKLALDRQGNLWVTDDGNARIRKIATDGTVSSLPLSQYDGSVGLAVDGRGNLILGEAFRVRRISPAGDIDVLLSPTSGFSPVGGIAVDANDNVYVTANGSKRVVLKITVAGQVVVVAGQDRGVAMHDGPPGAATLFAPGAVAVAADGSLVVADDRVLRRVGVDGSVESFAGQSEWRGDFDATDGVGGNATFRAIRAIKLDAAGAIYVLDDATLRKGVTTSAPAGVILVHPPTGNGNFYPSGGYRNVGAHATVTLEVEAAGTGPLTYQWLKDGVPLAAATSASLTLPDVADVDKGTYTVRVANAASAYTSLALHLTIYTPAFSAFTPAYRGATGGFLWGITVGPGRLVTVGVNGRILTSVNGTTWTAQPSGTTEWLVGVTYGGGKYVAVGDHGTILVSTDAVTWHRALASATGQRLNNVAYGEGTFVAVGEAGTIVTSPDAETWTAVSSGVTGWLRALTYVPPGNSDPAAGYARFYASGQGGSILESTPANPTKWTVYPRSGALDIEGFSDGGDAHPLGIGQDGLVLSWTSWTYYSKMGTAWSSHAWNESTIGLTARFRGVARAAGAIFATGENGRVAASQSIYGPWSFIPTGTTANLVAGVYFGNSLYVVGEDETILKSERLYPSRLMNLATRGQAGTGADAMFAGFVVSGSAPKPVLVRAVGPGLQRYGVTGVAPAPSLTLYDGASRPLASNARWQTASDATAISGTAAAVGAFPLDDGSADSALLMTLAPGAYTAQVSSASGGVALVEVYDAEPLATEGSRAINISTRGIVGTGANRLTAGFVVSGSASRRVLIRAVGPSLAPYGLTGLLAEPVLRIYSQSGWLLRTVDARATALNHDEIANATSISQAFGLQDGAKDVATVIELLPGNYTAEVSGANDTTGLALVEVYDLP